MGCPKNILITGATSDFGAAFAKKFSEAGVRKIYLHGRNAEKLAALQKDLSCETEALLCDLSDKREIDTVFTGLKNIDLLINNAGGALGLEKVYEADRQDWEQMLDANVSSLIRITRHILPDMVARRSGHVMNISSVAGSWPYPGGHVYCAAKAFATQFSLAMRSDLVGTNVRVTSIEPGLVETSFSVKRFKGDKDKAAAVYAGTRPLKAADIAETVFFAANMPEHANITRLEIMATDQATGPFLIHRREK